MLEPLPNWHCILSFLCLLDFSRCCCSGWKTVENPEFFVKGVPIWKKALPTKRGPLSSNRSGGLDDSKVSRNSENPAEELKSVKALRNQKNKKETTNTGPAPTWNHFSMGSVLHDSPCLLTVLCTIVWQMQRQMPRQMQIFFHDFHNKPRT